MKLAVRDEPPLEFAGGARHVDPAPRHRRLRAGRRGQHRPADHPGRHRRAPRRPSRACAAGWTGAGSPSRPRTAAWAACSSRSPASTPRAGFRSTLVWDSRLERHIRDRDLRRLDGLKPQDAVRAAVELYAAELEILDEEPGCNVILIARPDTLPDAAEPEADPAAPWKKVPPAEPADDFRALLKAAAMRYSRPIQIIRRTTWDPAFKPPGEEKRRLQDEATRAWNLHTALYYKAGGVPWRLPRDPADLDTCYVGHHLLPQHRPRRPCRPASPRCSTSAATASSSAARPPRSPATTGSPTSPAATRSPCSPRRSAATAASTATCPPAPSSTRPRPTPPTRSPGSARQPTTPTSTPWKCSGCPPSDPARLFRPAAAPAAARHPAQHRRPAARPLHPGQRPVLRHLPRHVHPVPAAVPPRRDRIQPRVPRRRTPRPDQDELEPDPARRPPADHHHAPPTRSARSCATSARTTGPRAATPSTCRCLQGRLKPGPLGRDATADALRARVRRSAHPYDSAAGQSEGETQVRRDV